MASVGTVQALASYEMTMSSGKPEPGLDASSWKASSTTDARLVLMVECSPPAVDSELSTRSA